MPEIVNRFRITVKRAVISVIQCWIGPDWPRLRPRSDCRKIARCRTLTLVILVVADSSRHTKCDGVSRHVLPIRLVVFGIRNRTRSRHIVVVRFWRSRLVGIPRRTGFQVHHRSGRLCAGVVILCNVGQRVIATGLLILGENARPNISGARLCIRGCRRRSDVGRRRRRRQLCSSCRTIRRLHRRVPDNGRTNRLTNACRR